MHVGFPQVGQLRWYLRPLFWLQKRRFGAHLVPAMVWAQVPPLFAALNGFNAALERRGSPLDPVLRALVQTRISQVNHCAFCIDMNAARVLERGAGAEKMRAIARWRDSAGLFSELECAALDYAEAVTRTDGRVDDAMVARLGRHLDQAALIELTALIAFQNLSSKFNAALELPSQGLCRLDAGDAVDTTPRR